MTLTDLEKTTEALIIIKRSGIIQPDAVIGIHSPWPDQIEQIKSVFPESVLHTYFYRDEQKWDILEESKGFHDLLCFQNVFHYINAPEIAFKNVFNSCRYLLFQDRIIRDRGKKNTIFCDDGDCMRYRIGPVKSNFESAFDLLSLNSNIVFCTPYLDDGLFIHVIALFKGFL